MTKTKIIKTILTIVISSIMVPAVLLSSVHANDLATYRLGKTKSPQAPVSALAQRKTAEDPMSKSLGELHNHIDKTMVKNLTKSSADQATMQARRKSDALLEARPINEMWFELTMLVRFTLACALAR